jgi:putative transposase
MSAAISPATSQNYGVQRVCRIWGLPRSSFYHAILRVAVVHPAVRRGPVPPVAEDRLLTAIQADLAASPFHGEGHRKVWARLRYGLGLVIGRNRVLRLMHENQLLSPNRHPPRPANDHDGTILTTAPDRLWGTDASMVQTVADGRVWVFAALDHFNSEVIGHYVSTDGSRFAALEPISQAVSARFRGIEADVARGVTVRADHGPQYISGHFTHQIAHWGMALSHSFPRQPQTNGVVERFFRTLKEQVIYGRVFHTVAEVKAAVATFITRYNASWRLARLGYMSPLDYRLRHATTPPLKMAA